MTLRLTKLELAGQYQVGSELSVWDLVFRKRLPSVHHRRSFFACGSWYILAVQLLCVVKHILWSKLPLCGITISGLCALQIDNILPNTLPALGQIQELVLHQSYVIEGDTIPILPQALAAALLQLKAIVLQCGHRNVPRIMELFDIDCNVLSSMRSLESLTIGPFYLSGFLPPSETAELVFAALRGVKVYTHHDHVNDIKAYFEEDIIEPMQIE